MAGPHAPCPAPPFRILAAEIEAGMTSMPNAMAQEAGPARAQALTAFAVLWLLGAAMRVPILSVPPVIPLIRAELGMSETEVGLLMGLPVVLFAAFAVPGSALIARYGAALIAIVGLVVSTVASAGRGLADDVWTLYAASIALGFGIAIMQPAVPRLVREWVPDRIGLGTAIYTNGMLIGAMFAVGLTLPVVMPLVEQSWRLAQVVWSLPGLATLPLLMAFALRRRRANAAAAYRALRHWNPDWTSRLTWFIGLTFGGNTSLFYGANAFIPELLSHSGEGHLISHALGWLNGIQIVVSAAMLIWTDRMQGRAWPFWVFGLTALAGVIGLMTTSGVWIVVFTALLGVGVAVTFILQLALPPFLSAPDDVHRTAAAMFAIGYGCGVVVPALCGALWDLTGLPWMAFVPLAVAAVVKTVFGALVSRYPAHGAPAGA